MSDEMTSMADYVTGRLCEADDRCTKAEERAQKAEARMERMQREHKNAETLRKSEMKIAQDVWREARNVLEKRLQQQYLESMSFKMKMRKLLYKAIEDIDRD
jgi:hypothetical protein